MSLNILGTSGTNYLLTGSANFVLPQNAKLIQDSAILYRPEQVSVSQITRRQDACLVSTTVQDILTNSQTTNYEPGRLFSDGTRLAYLSNLANSPVSQSTNYNGGLVTSAYEGNAAIGSIPGSTGGYF
jgi:hypothetical protein